jgi:hypothetical protein
MVTERRQNIKVKVEKRLYPRLDFHCDVVIRGIAGVRTITDISMGGFFFELQTDKKLKMGQVVEAAIYLPTEQEPIKVKARFVNQTSRGIGCQFINMSLHNREAVRQCFETFKDTLPIG